MGADQLNEMCSNFLDWIQGSHGVLKNEGDFFPSDGTHFLVRETQDVFSINSYFSVNNHAWRRDKANYRKPKGGLSGTGFTNQSQGFTFLQGEGYIIYGSDVSPSGPVIYCQRVNF